MNSASWVQRMEERWRTAVRTGQWWTDPWWEEDAYYQDGLYSKEEAHEAFEKLKEVFDASWTLQARDHPLRRRLIHQSGLVAFQDLVSLGRDLLIADREGLGKKLKRRIMDAKGYPGARFELEVLSHLISKGFGVERHPDVPRTAKRSDFKVTYKGETIFLELKRLQLSERDKAIFGIIDEFIATLVNDPVIASLPHKIVLELAPELLARTKSPKERQGLLQWLPLLGEKLRDSVRENLKAGRYGPCQLAGLAKYNLAPGEGKVTQGGIAAYLEPQGEAWRIVKNALLEGVEQLPEGSPGVIMVHGSEPPRGSLVRLISQALEQNGNQWPQVSAFFLVYRYLLDRIWYSVECIFNPHGMSIKKKEIFQVLCQLGEPMEKTLEEEFRFQRELNRIVQELKEMGALRVLLFGSRARSENKPGSDFDLVVVLPSGENFVGRAAEIYRRLKPKVEVDILVYTPEEFARGNPLIDQAKKEGRLLYERP